MKIEVYREMPIFRRSKANVNPGLLSIPYQILTAFYQAETWDDVLKLHTPASQKFIEQLGMKAHWESRDPSGDWTFTYSATCLLGGESGSLLLLTQHLRGEIPEAEYEGPFQVAGYRFENGTWLCDYTASKLPLAQIMSRTPPGEIEERLRRWYRDRLALVTWADVVKFAEPILAEIADVE